MILYYTLVICCFVMNDDLDLYEIQCRQDVWVQERIKAAAYTHSAGVRLNKKNTTSKILSKSIYRMPMESLEKQKNLICPRIFLTYDLNQVLKKKLSIIYQNTECWGEIK